MNVKIGYSKLAGAVIALANRDVEKALVSKHKISASAFFNDRMVRDIERSCNLLSMEQ